MKNRIIAFVLILLLTVPLLPTAVFTFETGAASLKELTEFAAVRLYDGSSEQTRKYLYDRYMRALEVLDSASVSNDEAAVAYSELSNALDSLVPMVGRTDSPIEITIGQSPSPDTAEADFVQPLDGLLYDGLYIVAGSEGEYSVTIMFSGGEETMLSGVVFSGNNAVIPFDCFDAVFDSEITSVALCSEGKSPAFAAIYAYCETVEKPNADGYAETLISERGQIVDYAYYKILESTRGQAITMSSDTDFTIEDNRENDASQMWQLAPHPDKSGTFLLINKEYTSSIEISGTGTAISGKSVDFNTDYQGWTLTSRAEDFTIQVRSVGKLTVAGTSVKATTLTSSKKFNLYLVSENKYVSDWNDEFDGSEVDSAKWNVIDGFFANNTMHTDEPDNLSVSDGNLVMKTIVDQYNGYETTATYMNTGGKYSMTYGRVEVRAKLGIGDGYFPAFWMMPDDLMNCAGSEIDIMEMTIDGNLVGADKLIATLHWASDAGDVWNNQQLFMATYGNKPLADEYHTYAIEIDYDQIRYYFDGIQYSSVHFTSSGMKYAFGDVSRYIIFNTSGRTANTSGGLNNPDWNYPDDYTLYVDYIRTWVPSAERSSEVADFTTDNSTQTSESLECSPNWTQWYYTAQLASSPDGSELVVTDMYGFLYIYDAVTMELKKRVAVQKYGNFTDFNLAEYSPDGQKLAVSTNRGSILVFDTSDYDAPPIKILNGATIHEFLLWTDDSGSIISGGFNGGSQTFKNPVDNSVTQKWYFRVFSAADGSKTKELYVGSDPRCAALSDGYLAVGTASGTVFLFDVTDGYSEYAQLAMHDRAVRAAAFSPDGSLLVSVGEDGKILIWDAGERTLSVSATNVNQLSVKKVTFSPDGRRILTTGSDCAAHLYDAKTGRLVSLLGGFGRAVKEAVYSPNGKYIAVASYDGTLKVFKSDGTYLKTLVTDGECGYSVSHIVFSENGRYLWMSTHTRIAPVKRWLMPGETPSDLIYDGGAHVSDGFIYSVIDDNVTIEGYLRGDGFINIPETIDGFPVTAIGDYAFSGYGIGIPHMRVSFPSSLESIGVCAFADCHSLRKAVFPDSLKTIGASAFISCNLLECVEIPDGVTSIGEDAFRGLRGPRYIKIGSGAKTVNGNASFAYCWQNRAIVFEEGIENVFSGGFTYTALLERIYIPSTMIRLSTQFITTYALANDRIYVYGYEGSYAETFAATSTRYVFIPLSKPNVTGVTQGAVYDLFDEESVSAEWDHAHAAYLNGRQYYSGKKITEPGEYTMKVINGYDEFTTEISFEIVDTTPISGDVDGSGELTVSDALLTLRMAAEIIECDKRGKTAADIDNDGMVTIADALMILRRSIGIL